MLVGRLSNLEADLGSVKESIACVVRHQKLQEQTARLANSRKPRGTPFSGTELCGRAVDLQVFGTFGPEGDIHNLGSDALIITKCDSNLFEDFAAVWTSDAPDQWDGDVCAAWGSTKYAEIRRKTVEWYNDDNNLSPSCRQVGLHESGYEDIDQKVYETALKHRIPGLLAFGGLGIMVSSTTIGAAVGIMDRVYDLRGIPLSTSLVIHSVSPDLQPLAISILRQCEREDEWTRLPARTRAQLIKDQDAPYVFFDREALVGCV